ncbi:hypothetical protein BJ322DRAFT_1025213 [Thelephora terrestris]|uniref:Uncharacterized protein n=1 Tax=Thelephora terrestris TaxID=56493 RepID=A0A9P6H4X3_9AGAM|nr:hypothetical protein BJ322DRAFT_1025213 [Thelephora terrestris]
MNTRKKNKSARPGIPDMSPSMLALAGLLKVRQPAKKKLTKDQTIAALRDELRAAQESMIASSLATDDLDAGGDTEPTTDVEELETTAGGKKRKASGLPGSASKLKRSRAVNPFEFSSRAHSGATGLVDNWRSRIAPLHGTPPPRSSSSGFLSQDHETMLQSPMSSRVLTSMSTRSDLSFEENPLPTYTLPKIVRGGSTIYPRVKDLPEHIR